MLASEAIVETGAGHSVTTSSCSPRLLTAEIAACAADRASAPAMLARRSSIAHLNPRLATAISSADLIIYAPGTQHSSLFPSYLTRGLAPAIAGTCAR